MAEEVKKPGCGSAVGGCFVLLFFFGISALIFFLGIEVQSLREKVKVGGEPISVLQLPEGTDYETLGELKTSSRVIYLVSFKVDETVKERAVFTEGYYASLPPKFIIMKRKDRVIVQKID